MALEAVRRIDRLFDIERTLNGMTAGQRLAARQELSKPPPKAALPAGRVAVSLCA